ncbi:hypothetical protein ALC56_05566, partial [Trachymyrmex septentrionalis]
REKIVKEIEKTSESIRKKHRALKTGRIEKDIVLDRHFKPIIKPLLQILLGQKYVKDILRRARGKESETCYSYFARYLLSQGLIFDNKLFDYEADNIIINDVRYAGTRGLYELFFKRIPDDLLYTEDDMHKYKSMLLATNAHKHKHHSQSRVLSNKGYKHVIAPLMIMLKKQKKSGRGLPHAMTLNNSAIDYVHWDDLNELVDRLRLLDAS